MLKILFFTSKYCAPCKKIKPFVEALPMQYPQVEVQIIDIDENKPLANQYSAVFLPTIVWLKNGVEIARQDGGANVTQELLQNLAATHAAAPASQPATPAARLKNAADWFFIALGILALTGIAYTLFKPQ